MPSHPSETCCPAQVHIGEQRLQDSERQQQQAHSAAQALAAEKGDLHAQLAALEQTLSEKAALNERIADLEGQVSPSQACTRAALWFDTQLIVKLDVPGRPI